MVASNDEAPANGFAHILAGIRAKHHKQQYSSGSYHELVQPASTSTADRCTDCLVMGAYSTTTSPNPLAFPILGAEQVAVSFPDFSKDNFLTAVWEMAA